MWTALPIRPEPHIPRSVMAGVFTRHKRVTKNLFVQRQKFETHKPLISLARNFVPKLTTDEKMMPENYHLLINEQTT